DTAVERGHVRTETAERRRNPLAIEPVLDDQHPSADETCQGGVDCQRSRAVQEAEPVGVGIEPRKRVETLASARVERRELGLAVTELDVEEVCLDLGI